MELLSSILQLLLLSALLLGYVAASVLLVSFARMAPHHTIFVFLSKGRSLQNLLPRLEVIVICLPISAYKMCSLSLDLGVRLNLALFNKLWRQLLPYS